MKESKFVGQNKEKWLEFDKILRRKNPSPSDLNRLFVELTDDLSYARSKYRNRSVRVYLNWMMQRIFHRLYRRKNISGADVVSFFKDEIPYIMYVSRRFMLVSLVVFILGATIGVVSSYHDPSFASLVLGDEYVEITLENIESGDPMRIYKSAYPENAFIEILKNNAQIDIMVFASGLLFGILSLFFLVKNAVMVGVFQFFFYQHGGFSDSVLTIWMHGAIEISTIVLICGAGLLGGSGFMFPGTRTRFQAFRISGLKAAKLLVAILPLTLLAAFIESFITPLQLPAILNAFFILITFGGVLFYFVWYPYYRYKGVREEGRYDVYLPYVKKPEIKLNSIKSSGEIVVDAFYLYAGILSKVIPWIFAGTAVVLLSHYYLGDAIMYLDNYQGLGLIIHTVLQMYHVPDIGHFFANANIITVGITALTVAVVNYTTIRRLATVFPVRPKLVAVWNKSIFNGLLLLFPATALLMFDNNYLQFCFLLLVLFSSFIAGYGMDMRRRERISGRFGKILSSGIGHTLSVFALLFIVSFFLFLIVQSPLLLFLQELIVDAMGNTVITMQTETLIKLGISLFVLFAICPLFVLGGILTYFHTVEKRYSFDLEDQLKQQNLI